MNYLPELLVRFIGNLRKIHANKFVVWFHCPRRLEFVRIIFNSR